MPKSMFKFTFEQIVFSLPQFVVVGDLKMKILYINKTLLEFLGYKSSKELIGKPIENLVPEEEKGRFLGVIQRILVKKHILEYFPTYFITHDKRKIQVSYSGFPLFNSQKKLIGSFGVASDLRQLSGLLESLRRAKVTLEKGVREKTRQLEKSKKELQKRVEALEKFQSLTVGRELKMVELKEEIARLKQELGEGRRE